MPGDALMALAQFAGQTVAQAAITDAWESVRGRFARLIGRDSKRKTETAEQWLDLTHDQLTAAAGSGLVQVQKAQAERWADRFADLLDEDPELEAELRMLTQQVAEMVSVDNHGVVAGRDVSIRASSGGIAAGTIHGSVTSANPTNPGPLSQ